MQIPRTALHVVNMASAAPADDFISRDDLHEIPMPLERGVWKDGRFRGCGQFVGLQPLEGWVHRRPTDPITGQPMDWSLYDAVEWEDPPEALRGTRYATDTDEAVLRHRQNSIHARVSDFEEEEDESQMRGRRRRRITPRVGIEDMNERGAFRRGMAAFSRAYDMDSVPVRAWLADYWRLHPYQTNSDPPDERPNAAGLAVRGAPAHAARGVPAHHFRRDMAERILPSSADFPWVYGYWIRHPLATDEDMQDAVEAYHRRLAEMQAMEDHVDIAQVAEDVRRP